MNREIKFRVWDKEMGKMRYDIDTYTLRFLNENDNYTLMQFTNLTDKNGKECYEGDLIDGRYGKDTVEWNENICGFTPFAWGSNAPTSEEFEVIGNIYENPELLKPSQSEVKRLIK